MTNNAIDENRRVLLTELNGRARAYASQLWQIPFAYLALVGVLLTQLNNDLLSIGLFFVSAFGVSVLVHMFFAVHFHNKTVHRIIELEKIMCLGVGTSAKPGGTVAPLMSLVFLGVLSPVIFFFRSHLICLIALIYVVLVLFGFVSYCMCNHISGSAFTVNGNVKEQYSNGCSDK